MKKKVHRGELVRSVTRQKGYYLSDVAKGISKTYRTLSNWLKDADLDDDRMALIGSFLDYDFGEDLDDYNPKHALISEPGANYGFNLKSKDELITTIELHKSLMTEQRRITAVQADKIDRIKELCSTDPLKYKKVLEILIT